MTHTTENSKEKYDEFGDLVTSNVTPAERILYDALSDIRRYTFNGVNTNIYRIITLAFHKFGELKEGNQNENDLLNLLVFYQSKGDQYRNETLLEDVVKDFNNAKNI